MKSYSRLAASACLLAGVLTSAAVMARDHEDALALGDSVVFGYITQAGYEYLNPNNFIGYPEYLDVFDDLDFANAACPGETTGSFLSSTAPDNGCREFRSTAPLHVAYQSTQLNFARSFLSHHHHVRLVTISLGANDLFLLEGSCASAPDPAQCVAQGLPAVLQTIATNMATALGLLNASPQDQFACDVHPSQSGQRLIARTVARAFAAAHD